jgi:hypothetical protein
MLVNAVSSVADTRLQETVLYFSDAAKICIEEKSSRNSNEIALFKES